MNAEIYNIISPVIRLFFLMLAASDATLPGLLIIIFFIYEEEEVKVKSRGQNFYRL